MFFPHTDSELAIWLRRFSQVLASRATMLDLTPAEVTGVADDAAMFSFLVDENLPAFETAVFRLKEYKRTIKDGPVVDAVEATSPMLPIMNPPVAVEPGIVPRLNELIRRIMTSPSYTDALGEELGLVNADHESPQDPANAKPTGRAIGQIDNEVRVEFSKSAFDGVLIESRRAGQQEWSKLAMNSFSPYVDSRPPVNGGKPEVREYRMRFMLSDEPVGEWSDVLVATASF